MPYYDFICPVCGLEEEINLSSPDLPICADCAARQVTPVFMHRIYKAGAMLIKGLDVPKRSKD